MKNTQFNLPNISLLAPSYLKEKMFFQLCWHGVPIAHARLERIGGNTSWDHNDNVIDLAHHLNHPAYVLKMIEVSQNYRQLGLGTALLREILDYCRDRGVRRLCGEIKGDLPKLRNWYASNGFNVAPDDQISITP